MPVSWTYTPPAVNAIPIVTAAAQLAEHAAAEMLLAKSQAGVPVESGRLRDSGTVTDTAEGSVVGYGFDDADGKNSATDKYAVKQHEDLELHHPNGGGAKWLESAMHAEHADIAAAAAAELRKVIGP